MDNVVGAQLSLPAGAGEGSCIKPCPGFAHVSELADQRVQHPSKYLHPGQQVSCRGSVSLWLKKVGGFEASASAKV